jgi:hypothetical protein
VEAAKRLTVKVAELGAAKLPSRMGVRILATAKSAARAVPDNARHNGTNNKKLKYLLMMFSC